MHTGVPMVKWCWLISRVSAGRDRSVTFADEILFDVTGSPTPRKINSHFDGEILFDIMTHTMAG